MASRYFVGNGTNWSSTSSWSTSSGGASGAAVPANGDDVILDVNSPGNLTIDASTNTIRSLVMTGFTHTVTHSAAVTLNIGGATAPVSNIAVVFAGTYTISNATTSAISIADTSAATNTYNFNGATLGNVTINNGTTTTTQLVTNGFTTGATATVTLTQGGFNTNGQTCSWGYFSSTNSNTRTLTLGASAISISATGFNGWNMGTITGLTFNCGTSVITFTGAGTGTMLAPGSASTTFYGLVFSGGGTSGLTNTGVTCTNLTITGAANKTGTFTFVSGTTTTVTGTLTITGNSVTNRILVSSATNGTAATLTAAAVSLSNVDFMDITGAGAATWSGSSLGNCLGNSNITFTTAVTRYGVVAGNWSSTATWSATSGGSGGQTVPLPQDTVNLDANSAAGTYTVDMPRMGANLTCTGFTRTLSWGVNTILYGSITLASSMASMTGTTYLTLSGRSSLTITSAGKTFPNVQFNIIAPGATYTLQDSLVHSGLSGITFSAGTFTANGFNVTSPIYSFYGTSVTTINMGTGTWSISGTGAVWTFSSGTINANTSTLQTTNTSGTATFTAGAFTPYNFTVNGAGGTTTLGGALTCTGTVTLTAGTLNTNGQTCSWGIFNSSNSNTRTLTMGASSITCTGTGTAWNLGTVTGLTVSANTSTITLNGADSTFTGGAFTTWNSIVLSGSGTQTASSVGQCVNFTRTGTATKTDALTVGGFTSTGTLTLTGNSATNRLLVQSSTFGTAVTVTAAAVSLTNVDFMDITGSGAASPFTGTSLGNGQGNSGITFTTASTLYAVSGATWSTAGWSTTSGGSSGARVPLPQDTATLDANSPSSITLDMPRIGNLICTGYTHTLTLAISPTIYGSLTLAASMTFAGGYTVIFAGRSSYTITNGGNSFHGNVYFYFGTYTLADSLVQVAGSGIYFATGSTFNANGFNLTASVFNPGSGSTVNMGSGTWTASGTGTVWNTGATINAGTSTIVISDTSSTAKTFTGSGYTYNNLKIPSGGAGAIIFTGANTFNTLTIGAQNTVTLPASTITTTSNLVAVGVQNGYLALPGVSGNYASTPNAAPNQITGNITIDVNVAMASWTPAAGQMLVAKIPLSGNFAYRFYVNTSGSIGFDVWNSSSVETSSQSSVATGFTAGSQHWVRVSLTLSNGSNSVCQFFTSSDGVTWTQLGSNVTQGIINSIYNATSALEIGSESGGTNLLAAGNFYEVKLYNSALGSGSGTPVFDANFATKTVGSNTFTESSSNAATVTISGAEAQQGDGRISINSSVGGTQATISQASGTVSSNNLVLQDSKAQGGASFYAGSNSVNVSNNSGWTFSNAPGTKTITPGGGNWSATTTWVEGAVPLATDAVVASVGSGALTIDTNAATCLTFDMTNYTNTLTHTAAVTFTVAGSLFRLVSGMVYTLGNATTSALAFTQSTSGTVAITTGGKTLGNVTTASGLTSSSATYQLQDTNTLGSTATWAHNAGTLTTNNQTVSWGAFVSSSASNTRVLTLGSSSVTCTAAFGTAWDLGSVTSNFTLNAGTSSLTFSGSAAHIFPGNFTYNNVSFTGSGAVYIGNATVATFANLTRISTAVKTDSFGWQANHVVTGTLTLTGNSLTNRLLVQAYSLNAPAVGTAVSITAATVALTNVDFMDITGAGAASPFTGTSLGDCQGNSGITMTTAVTRYGVVAGNWSSTATWSATSGGSGGQTVPLAQDTVYLDANSAAGTYSLDMPRVSTVNCTGFTRTLATTAQATSWFGNITFVAGMTFSLSTGLMTWLGRGSQTVTTGGKVLPGVAINAIGGTYQHQDSATSSQWVLQSGTWDFNNFNITNTTTNFNNNGTSVRTLKMGSGTFTISNSGSVWTQNTTNLTIAANTATIVLSDTSSTAKTFSGGGANFNGASLTIAGGGTGAVTISGSNTFNVLGIGAPKTVTFTASTTQTLTRFSAAGSSGNVITLNSTTPGTDWTLSQASGTNSSDYLSLQDSTATGGASWYAGSNSTNVSNNTGWTFSYPASGVKTIAPGGGNWSSTSTWVEGAVPAATDDVVAVPSSGQLTIDTNSAVCRSADFTTYTNTLTHNAAIALSIGSSTANGTLALKFVSTMTYALGNVATSQITFVSTSATQLQITSAGKTFGTVVFSGSGGSWLLVDGFSTGSTATVSLASGTLNTNGQTCSWGLFTSQAGVRTLTLGASSITLTGSSTNVFLASSGTASMTVNAGTSTITFTGATACMYVTSSFTWYNVVFSGSGSASFQGASQTFTNLTRTGSAVKTDSFATLSSATQTVTGTLTLAGNSLTNRLLVYAGTLGTAGTFNAAAVSLTNVDFADITGAGAAAPWTGTSLGDCQGNSGITMTPALTIYGVNTSANSNWSTASWSASSGGSGGARVPLPQDSVFLDANSGTHTYTVDMPRFAGNLTTTSFVGTLTTGSISSNASFYGNLTIGSGMTWTAGSSQYIACGRSSQTINTNGVTSGNSIQVTAVSGTYQLLGNLTVAGTAGTLTVNSGTFDANGYNVQFGVVNCFGTATRAIKMGSGTWTIIGTNGTIWNLTSTGMTLTQSTSTIVLSDTSSTAKTFAGAGLTYNNLTIAGGGTGAVTISGSNTFNILAIGAPKTVTFTAGTTQTLARFSAAGSSGNVITLNSTTPGTAWTLSQASGTNSSDYLSLQDSIATGGASWYAGSNSTNVSNNTGWTFSYPASGVKTISPAGGNYSATTAWVEGAVPAATDNVVAALSSGALTIDTNAATCLTFDMTNYTNTLTHTAAVTFTVAGSLFRLVSGMVYTLGNASTSALAFTQSTTGTVAITTGGMTLGSVTTASGLSSSSATYQLQDTNTLGVTATWTHNAGTLNTNNQTVSWGAFLSANSNTRTLTLGASTINILSGTSTSWNTGTVTNLTITANTATIACSVATFSSSWLVTAPLNFNGASLSLSPLSTSTPGLHGTTTWANVTLTGSAQKTSGLQLNGGNLTITGTFTITPNSVTNALLISSTNIGTTQTITAASLVCSNRIDFQDITGAGAATWTTAASGATYFGDCQGNSGITFTTGVPQAWSGNTTGNWSTAANWTSRVPLPQDNVTIAALTSGTITVDMPRIGANISFTGSTAGTLSPNTQNSAFGNVTLVSGVTITGTQTLVLAGRGAQTFTTAGVTLANTVSVQCYGGSYTLQSNLVTSSTGSLQLLAGTFNANGYNVTVSFVPLAGAITRSLTMGSGTWTVTGTGAVWTSIATGLTITPGTSTIVLSDTSSTAKTFAGGGFTYSNLTIAGGSASPVTITGANTFNAFAVGTGVLLTMPASTTNTVTNFSAAGQNYGYQYLPGVSGNYVSASSTVAVPSGAALTLDACITLISSTNIYSLVGRWGTGGATWSYLLQFSNNSLALNIATGGGINTHANLSTTIASAGYSVGQKVWVRASWNGTQAMFYTSPDGSTWTQLGATQALSCGTPDAATGQVLEIGSNGTGTANLFPGNFYEARIYNSALGSGSGTAVFDANFATKAVGNNTFTESSSNAATVTINGATAQVGDGRIGIVSSTPGTQATISQASGIVSSNYLSLQDSNATGGASFYAGAGSINVSNNSGWLFSSPSGIKTISPAGGNYSSTTAWVEGAVPAATDAVGALAGGNSGQLTIDTSAATCLTFDMTNYTNTLTHASAVTFTVAGSKFLLVSGMTYTLGSATTSALAFTQSTSGTVAITTGGKTLGNVTTASGLTSSSATYQLQDTNTIGSTATWTHNAGTLTTNNQTVSWGLVSSNNSNTRALTLGTSNITITGASNAAWLVQGAGLTASYTSSTITFTNTQCGLASSNLTYGTVIATGATAFWIQGTNNTFGSLSVTGSAVKTAAFSVTGSHTVTGAVTLAGNSVTNRLFVSTYSSSLIAQPGTQLTIALSTAGTATVTNVDFMDIAFTGTNTPVTGTSLGNCLGNSGITFDAAVAQTWSGNTTGNWSTAASWTSRVPLPQDNVSINALTSGTVTIDMPRVGANISLVGSTGGSVTATIAPTAYGSISLASALGGGVGGAGLYWTLAGRGSQTVSMPGTSSFASGCTINAPGGTYTPTTTFRTNAQLQLNYGTFNDGVQSINVPSFSMTAAGSASGKALIMSSTWTLSTSGTVWGGQAGVSLTPGASTIVLSDTTSTAKIFTGAGLTYNNLTIAGGKASPVTITGANTFNTLAVGTGVLLTMPASSTTTVTNFSAAGQSNGYQYLSGVSGNYVSSPNSTALSITGNLTIDVHAAMASWTAANDLVAKWNTTGTISYYLYVASGGKLNLLVAYSSSAYLDFTSTVAPSFTAGSAQWVRASLTTGGGGVNFYTSSDGATWTQLGTTVSGSIPSIYATTQQLEIGSHSNGTSGMAIGNFYEARIYNSALGSGSGTPVFDANFATKTVGNNTFTESSSNAATVTINGATAQVGDGRIGIVSSTPGTQATISQASGTVSSNYLSLQDSNATGGASFYAGTGSINVSNNSGWLFSSPSGIKTISPAGGNYSATTAWVEGAVPAATDAVGALAGGNSGALIIDTSAATCLTFDMTNYTNTLTHTSAVTFTIAGSLFRLVSGMTYALGNAATSALAFTQSTTGTVAITTGGKTLGNVTMTSVSSTATYTLQDTCTSTGTVSLYGGTLSTNSQTCSFYQLTCPSGAGTLNLGSSAISLSMDGASGSAFQISFTGVTISSNTAVITLTAFNGFMYTPTQNYNGTSFVFSGGGTCRLALGNPTVANLTVIGSASKTASSFSCTSGSTGFTATGILTLTGNSAVNRLNIVTASPGTTNTYTAATVALTNVDFMDITGAGAAAPFTGTSLGDCQGNSGITFTAAVAQTWSGNTTGNWSNAANWTSRVPLPQDNVAINALTSGTVTADMPRLGASISFTGSTGGTYANSVNTSVFGSFTFASAVAFSGASLFLCGRGNYTFSSAGVALPGSIDFRGPTGTYTLQSDLTITSQGIDISAGTLKTAGHNVTAPIQSQYFSLGQTIDFGNGGTWTLTGTGTVWQSVATLVNVSGSTIVLSDTSSSAKTFNGQGGKTFGNLYVTGGGTGAVTITGANTFNQLSIGAPKTVTFTASTTQTTTRFSAVGSSGNVITMNSTTPGTAWTLSQASGTVSCDYLSLTDSTATGGASWYAGSNSTNVSDNTGWTFGYPASGLKTIAPGGGNWSSTGTWVEGAVPAATDDVIAILSGSSGQLTIDTSAAVCRSIDFTGYTNTLTHNAAVTLSIGSSTVNGSLALRFVTGMTYTCGSASSSVLAFVSTSATQVQITTAGKSCAQMNFTGTGSWIFQDTVTVTNQVNLATGTLNTNGQTINAVTFYASGTTTRTLTLGASVINLSFSGSSAWSTNTTTGLTFSAGTSTINLTGAGAVFGGGGLTFYNAVFSGSGTATITGANTYTSLTRTSTAVKTDALTIPSSTTQTVSGTLTLTGNSLTNRLLVQSSTVGTAGTFSAATVALTNVDFMDITGAGAASSFTGTSLGDCQGNSGITFTTAVAQTWSGNTTGNWSTAANWTSRVPLPQDNVSINALTSGTITLDMPRAGANINFTGTTGGTLVISVPYTMYGSLTFVSALTTSASGNSVTWAGRGSNTLTTAGKVVGAALNLVAPGGTLTLQDNITQTASALSQGAGTLNANGVNVSLLSYLNYGTAATLQMGSGTWTLNGTGTVWSRVGSATITPQTSTIVLANTSSTAKTFAGAGLTYNNLTITGGGTGAVIITGSNTFNVLAIGAPKTVTFTHGTAQTVTRFAAAGSSGNVITLNSDSAGNTWYLSQASGTVSCDYLSLQDSTATGGASWYAGSNSTNVSNNAGWVFSYAPNVKTISPVGGNYSATTAWVEGAVPAATDTVVAVPSSGSLTIDTNAATCLTFDMTNYSNTLTHTAAVTFTVAGSKFLLVSAMTYTLGNAATSALAFTQSTSGTVAITTGGKTLGNVTTASGLTSSSATYQLQDTNTIGAAATWTHNAGTLDTNSQTVTWGAFTMNNANTKTLTLGASTINLTGGGSISQVFIGSSSSSGFTLTANTATINLTNSGLFNSLGIGSWPTVNITCNGTNVGGFNSTNTVAACTVTGAASKTATFQVGGPLTITGAFTLNPNSSVNRLLIATNNAGTSRTITAGSLVCTNVVDFMDITGAGAATWSAAASGATYFGDCQGNSGITFTTAVAQTWSGNTTGNWSTAANWTSRVPLPQDNVSINALTSGTITADMPRLGANITLTSSTGGTVAFNSTSNTLFGNVTLNASVTISGSQILTLAGRGSQTTTCAGKAFPMQVAISNAASYTFQDTFTVISSFVCNGTVTGNGQNFSCFAANFTGVANLGSGTWTFTSGSAAFSASIPATINAGTSTIVLSSTGSTANTFAGGGHTYNNLTITGGGTGAVTISGSNTFNILAIGAPKTVTFTAGTTQTLTRFAAAGSSGNVITMNSTTPGTTWTLSQASGTNSSDWLSLQDSTATGGASWYAGSNSTNVSNNTGWTFGYPASGVKTISAAGGNWNATTAWVEGAVPAATDDVVAVPSSGALTINAAAACRSADFTTYTNTLTHNAAITLSLGSSTTNGSLSLKFVSGMTYTLGNAATSAITWVSTSGVQEQITSAGKTFGNLTFNGTGGSWISEDGFSTGSAATVTLTTGTLNTNGQICSWGFFSSNNSNTRSLTLGASTITCTGSAAYGWLILATNLTFSAGTSSIVLTGSQNTFQGGGVTYYAITIQGTGNQALAGALTCTNFTYTGPAAAGGGSLTITGITATGTVTLSSNVGSATYHVLVQSNTVGTARTITTAILVCTGQIDFQDITGAGAATWTTAASGATYFGDCQGNSGITFTAAVAQTWSGNTTGNWSTAANWTSRVPLPQDNVTISGLTSGTVTADMPRMGANLTLTGSTGGSVVFTSAITNTMYGNLTWASGVSATSGSNTGPILSGRGGSQTINSAGMSFYNLTMSSFGGTYTLQGNLTVTGAFTNQFSVQLGTFTANGYNVTTYGFATSANGTRAVNMGSGTWTLTGTGNIWNSANAGGLTLNPGTSTIVISDTSSTAKTFIGNGLTYNNLYITGGGTGAVTITGANTFNQFSIGAPKTVTFTHSTATTVSRFSAVGSSGNVITINSDSSGNAATLSQASGIVSCDYLSLQDSTAIGGAGWYAGTHSTNVSDNTGWTFGYPASGVKTIAPGGGNYSSTSTWVEGAVPTASDDVIAILSGSSGQLTIDTNSAVCRSADFTGYTNTLTHNAAITWTLGTSTTNGSLSLRFVAGMVYTLGNASTSAITFVSTSGTQEQITSAAKTLGNVTFNGTGGSWISQDGFSVGSAATVTLTSGTLNTNGQTCSWGTLTSSGTTTRTLTLGASSITITGSGGSWFLATATNMTLNAGTSTITFTSSTANIQFYGGTGFTYNNVVANNSGYFNIGRANMTFANFTRTGTAVKTDQLTLQFSITVTGTLTLAGNSVTNRLWVNTVSSTFTQIPGTSVTITAAVVALSNTDFEDIVGAGAASPFTGTSLGDCLGNSGITMTSALTLYGVNTSASANWSTASWSTSSGGSSGARMPLPQDSVVLDGNSGTHTYTEDMPRACANLTCTGFAGTLFWTGSYVIYGSITLGSAMTLTGGNWDLAARSAVTITSNGITFPSSFVVVAPGGTYTLGSNLNVSSAWLASYANTFNANGYNVTFGNYYSQGIAGSTTNLGSGTWTMTGVGNIWLVVGTVVASTSTIVIGNVSSTGKTFAGGGFTYNNLSVTGGGTGAVTITGSNTFNTFTIGAPKTVTFTHATTTTVASFVAMGSLGNIITINSDSVGNQATLSAASGAGISCDYLSIQDSNATGGASWNAGNNSTNVSDNTGWIFGGTPSWTGWGTPL
jgi:hypothetical protein